MTFDIGRNPDLAAVDVQNRVNQALGRMPAEVRTNGITVTKNTAGFLGGARLLLEGQPLRRAVHQQLPRPSTSATRSSACPASATCIIFGERKFAMRLWLDPQQARGARTHGRRRGRRAARAERAGRGRRASATRRRRPTRCIRSASAPPGRLTEATEFENVVVKAGPGRRAGAREATSAASSSAPRPTRRNLRFLGLEASGIGIQLLPSANALEVFDGVMARDGRASSRTSRPGSKWQLAFDNVVVVRESIIEVLKTLAEAIVLVILVMFLFLQNWRSTIIPAITIPVSLIGTFAFIKLFGFSINTLTLFGIVLATGIVVDDAIVVIENIERHMREYEKSAARRRRIDAMREVFGAVVVIGIVLVAVFVPVAFFPGTTGRLYQQFSLTIAFAVVLSVFNAVTLTPALSALLLDQRDATRTAGSSAASTGSSTRGTQRLRARRCAARCASRWSMLAAVRRRRWARPAWCSARCRRRSCREEDEGYFMSHRAGAGRRVARVHDRHRRSRPRRSCYERAGHRRRRSRSWASASAARRRTTA